jgi:hypothetical protein
VARVLYRTVRARAGYPEWEAIRREVERTIDAEVKPVLLGYFNRIVASWKNKPKFRARKRVTRDGSSVYVYPTGEHADKWRWVSGGTDPHTIEPTEASKRRAAAEGKVATLRFQWGGPGSYKPKTRPSGKYKGPGKASGPIVFFSKVEHPGNKPREFEKVIARWYRMRRPNFSRQVENAMRRGARKA